MTLLIFFSLFQFKDEEDETFIKAISLTNPKLSNDTNNYLIKPFEVLELQKIIELDLVAESSTRGKFEDLFSCDVEIILALPPALRSRICFNPEFSIIG